MTRSRTRRYHRCMSSQTLLDDKAAPRVLFTTERSPRHQQLALQAVPKNLQVLMLRNPDRAALAEHLGKTRFLISERVGTIDADLLKAAPRLEMILRIGSFTFDIDLEAARRAGVIVCRWPLWGVMRVAEHIVLQMLALAKRVRKAESIVVEADNWGESRRTDENTFAFNWSNMEGLTSLWGRTIGIIGFGEIGAELARRLEGWGCTVLYNKRRRLPQTVETHLALTYADAGALMAESDLVVNLLPYSAQTDMQIGRGAIAGMKDGAYLVSCGSGATLDEEAAARAVESGKLAGLALDTFEWEPIRAADPLIALANSGFNVMLTPHIAGGDKAGAAEERQGYYTTITSHLAGGPLRYRLA